MKLAELAAQPKLIKVSLADEETIKEFGEPLDFWMYDRQSMETFAKLTTVNYNNFGAVADIVKELVLDEEGKPVIKDGLVLPMNVLTRAIGLVVETLGKSASPSLTKTTENSN
jgi:hypothetical protein